MSWSKSASGTPEQVKGTCAGWADEQRKVDEGYSGENAQAFIDGHQSQVQGSAAAVVALVDALGNNVTLNVSAYGHHNGSPASASGGLSITYTGIVPQA